ncbi:MAG: flagellar biosynthesis protein FlhF [Gammaproteobacteria bacterium]|nr:flagellar biosynthesis protein FlhF [Gammaproteobacteria bacterium]
MKIVRHIAPDMRQAMRSIREQLGDDAVILSSRRIPEGVEVTAAIDFDATSLQGAMNAPAETLTATPLPTQPAAASRALASSRTAPAPTPAPAPAPSYSHAAASHYFPAAQASDSRPFAHILGQEATAISAPAPAVAAATHHESAPVKAAEAVSRREPTPAGGSFAPAGGSFADRSVADRSVASRSVVLNITAPPSEDLAVPAGDSLADRSVAAQSSDAMGTEMKMMRRMLETQLAQLAWNDMTRRAPVHVEILRELTEIGISQELSEYILKQLPEKVELGFARRFAIAGLSQYLLVTGDRWLENGGRVAFIGSTGVGKTTTLAKLAVRWVLRHGPRDIALVGSDTVRIGAQDQIQSLGQLLGVPVYTPENFESLPTLLGRLGDRHRMILIDTPGSSLRDGQLAHRLGVLSNCASQMETALVLAASTQAGAVEETVKRYASANPACCVLTKVDEAASLGGALSVLIKARLPVSYVSEGQRVPEDLRPARALELVSTAVRLAKTSGAAADEDLLRRRFGKAAHAII